MRELRASRSLIVALTCTVALILGLSACGGDDDDGGGSASGSETTTTSGSETTDSGGGESAGVVVTIQDFTFDVSEVAGGTAFEVQNDDSTDHTFTADDGAFDVEVPEGETVTVDALDPGTYAFHCNIHPRHDGDARSRLTRSAAVGGPRRATTTGAQATADR